MYSQIAQQFDKTRYKVWPCVAEFLTTVHVGALLEAGVGNGKNLAYAAELGFQTSGFDICHELVAIAAQRCPSADIYVHDIAEPLGPFNHGEVIASILHPFISRNNYWMLVQHGLFQTYFYGDKLGLDPNARDQYKSDPAYEQTAEFCAKYDEISFDPEVEYCTVSRYIENDMHPIQVETIVDKTVSI
jgi:hypothetical protein